MQNESKKFKNKKFQFYVEIALLTDLREKEIF